MDRIVIDFGSSIIKFGFAGETYPRYCIPTPNPKQGCPTMAMGCKAEQDSLFSIILEACIKIHGLLLVTNEPLKKIIICEGVLMNQKWKRALFKILCETFQFGSMVWIPQALSSLMAFGVDSGLVLDLGHLKSTCVPVFSHSYLYHNHESSKLAGKSLTNAIAVMHNIPETIAEFELEELKFFTLFSSELPAEFRFRSGSIVIVSASMRAELIDVLFDNQEEGYLPIHKLILECLIRAPIDIRKALCRSIILTGGTALIPGISKRLRGKLIETVNGDPRYTVLNALIDLISIRTSVYPSNILPWVGASLLGSIKDIEFL